MKSVIAMLVCILMAGAMAGDLLAAPYGGLGAYGKGVSGDYGYPYGGYGYPYGDYGYGYPTYGYGKGYGYPYDGFGYGYPSYGYGLGYPAKG